MSTGVRLGGKKQGWPNWTTPGSFLDLVRRVGPIYLDPCSNEASQVNPMTALHENGLEVSWREWSEGGLVFVNPPYDKAKEFVAKCVLESDADCEIIALLAARTDTRWAHSIFRSCNALLFWGPGRIRFENPPPGSLGNAPSIPSMVAYWGRRTDAFRQAFDGKGHFLLGGTISYPVYKVRP